MFPRSLKQGSCSLVPYDIFPLFPCSPKPLGDPPNSKSNLIFNSKSGSLLPSGNKTRNRVDRARWKWRARSTKNRVHRARQNERARSPLDRVHRARWKERSPSLNSIVQWARCHDLLEHRARCQVFNDASDIVDVQIQRRSPNRRSAVNVV